MDQWQYQLASTYADTFVSKGKFYLNMFYVCCAGLGGWSDNKCLRVLPAKVWRPKSGDPLDPHGWACTGCFSGYKAGWGCLCEILAPGMKHILYVRTEVPDKHIHDVRAMYHEDTLKPSSAQELYDNVPAAYPSLSALVREVPGEPGVGKVESTDIWNKIPMFNWFQIFNHFGVEMPAAPPSKRAQAKAKREANAAWWAVEQAKLAGVGGASSSAQ